MIATHLPDHFLPRRVFTLALSDWPITCQPNCIILKTIQVLQMNQRPFSSFEIHLMLLFLFISGWHYSRIIKTILGIQASFHLYGSYYMDNIIMVYWAFSTPLSRIDRRVTCQYWKLWRLRRHVWTVSKWRYRLWTLLRPY